MKKNMKKIIFVLLLLFVVGCSPSPVVNPVVEPIVSQEYNGGDYTIMPPVGWQVAKGTNNVAFTGSFDDLVQIIIDTEGSPSLENSWEKESSRLERSKGWVGTDNINDLQTVVNGYPAVVFDYTYTLGNELKVKEVIIVKDGKAFLISYQAQVDVYNDYISEFEESLSTFEITI